MVLLAKVGDKYQSGIYDGRKLVEKQNVILVNINYRLSCAKSWVFGFASKFNSGFMDLGCEILPNNKSENSMTRDQ